MRMEKIGTVMCRRWRHIAVFVFTLLVSVVWLHWPNMPLQREHDSNAYIGIAEQIINGDRPEFLFRSPTYPVYLSLFMVGGNLRLMQLSNMIIASLGAVICLWMLDRISQKRLLNMMIVMFVYTDFGVINWVNSIMTESISPGLLMFSVWTHLDLVRKPGNKTTVLRMGLMLLGDILLMFIKPIFFFIPFVMKTYLFVHYTRIDGIKPGNLKYLMVGAAANLLFLYYFVSYNFIVTGKSQLSLTGSANVFGRALNLGFLEQNAQEAEPEYIRTLKDIYTSNDRPKDPWVMCKLLEERTGVSHVEAANLFNKANVYFLSSPRNVFAYGTSAILAVPGITNSSREMIYTLNLQPVTGPLLWELQEIFTWLTRYKFLGLLFVCGLYAFFLKRDSKKALYTGMGLIVIIYTLLVVALFGYEAFYRLLVPIEILLDIITLSPFLWLLHYISSMGRIRYHLK